MPALAEARCKWEVRPRALPNQDSGAWATGCLRSTIVELRGRGSALDDAADGRLTKPGRNRCVAVHLSVWIGCWGRLGVLRSPNLPHDKLVDLQSSDSGATDRQPADRQRADRQRAERDCTRRQCAQCLRRAAHGSKIARARGARFRSVHLAVTTPVDRISTTQFHGIEFGTLFAIESGPVSLLSMR